MQWVNTMRNARVSVLLYANVKTIFMSPSNSRRQQQNLCDVGLAYGKGISTANQNVR